MNNKQADNTLSSEELAVRHALSKHLDSEVQNLDFNVTSRLAAARHRALDQQSEKNPWFRHFGWQSVAGSTAALGVAYVIGSQLLTTTTLTPSLQTIDVSTGDLMEDITILAEGDDIEFYQNIEFLEWLENNS